MALAVVTGASSGIGRAAAIELSGRGIHVVLAGRSEPRTSPAVDVIEAAGGSAEFLPLDLASLNSAREAGQQLAATGRTVDILVNNAGIGGTRGVTEDGFEIHFGVNHLGHFMFTHHLSPALRSGSRVVQLSSDMHRRATGIDFEAVRRKSRSFYGIAEYAVSKLANALFAAEMARRRPDLHTYAVHPGLVNTNIIPKIIKPFVRSSLTTPEQGADTVVWCATSEDVAGESGSYYARRRQVEPSRPALDENLAATLWSESEQWCGINLGDGPH